MIRLSSRFIKNELKTTTTYIVTSKERRVTLSRDNPPHCIGKEAVSPVRLDKKNKLFTHSLCTETRCPPYSANVCNK